MKNKKGFTLVELLAVIVLLSIVGVIGVTTIIGRMRKSKEKAMFIAAQDIVSIAEAYIETRGSDCNLGEPKCAKISKMIESRLLDSNVSNPRTIKDKDKGFWGDDEQDNTMIEEDNNSERQTDYKIREKNNKCYYKFDGYKYYFQNCVSLNTIDDND